MSKVMIEAAAALLEGAGGSLPITSLNKALFYLDLLWLLTHGRTITESTYLGLPAGPVVAKYDKRVIAALEDAGVAQQDESEDGLTKPVCLTLVPQYAVLTPEQRQAASRIGRWAASRTPSTLSDYSHGNDGWKLAWDQGLGARLPAQKIDLRIALQQLTHTDDWLTEEPDADVSNIFSGADDEKGTPW